MTTNVTLYAVDGPVVVYFQDGSSASCNAGQQKTFQIIDSGFCTISDSPSELDEAPPEGSEHPPPGYAFAHAMVEFWQEMLEELEEQPEVNPL